MKWLNYFTQNFKQKKALSREDAMVVGSYHMVGHPQWTPRRYESLVKEGFSSNVIVYRSIQLIAQDVASIPLQGTQTALIDQPNPVEDWAHFIEHLVTIYLLSGNAYIEAVCGNTHPEELHILRSDRIKIHPGANGLPEGYVYCVNQHKRFIPFVSRRLLHLKTFHPLNDWYGFSPVEAASRAIDQHNAVSSHNVALLQNGGRPSGALVIDNSQMQLTDAQRQELRESVNQLLSGADNAGRPLVLEGAFEWKEMGLTPKDLDFIEGKKMSGREIAQAFGVPPMLVGIQGDATFSNFKEARLHLWEETILPLAYKMLNALNKWLSSFGLLEHSLTFDLDKVPALQPKRDALWARMKTADFLTDDEKRDILGVLRHVRK